jgi:hypothetical protein
MATSMRTIQATMNGAGFSTNEMQALFDINPTILQNYLTGATANVNASTALVDTFVSGNSSAGTILGNCLQVEFGEGTALSASNVWFVEGHCAVTTNGTAGLKVQLTTYDGLTLVTGNSFVSWVMNVNGSAGGSGVTALNTPFGATVNAVSLDFTAVIQVASGYGRIGLQFSQNVSTAVNTSLGTYGYIRAESLLG